MMSLRMGRIMARPERGPGETAERGRLKRLALILGLCSLIGFVPGFFIGYTDHESLFDESTNWPAWLSLGMPLLLIGTAVIGGLRAQRHYDEHQRAIIYKTIAFAAAAYFFSYPAWFFLWKGDFLPEPMHGALFGIFYFAFVIAYIYNRLRS